MDKELGTYVAERRRSLNLRQSDLADKLGYSTQAISKFEGLESQISLSVVPDLCNLLGESIDDFFLRTSEPVRPLNPNKPIDQKLLSSNLAVFRENQGMTLVQESQAIGIAKNTLISYEKGSSLPTLDAMDRFFVYAKVTPSSFLYERLPAKGSTAPLRSKKPLIAIFSSIIGLAMVGGVAYWAIMSFHGFGSKESGAESSAASTQTPAQTTNETVASSSASTKSDDSASSSSSHMPPFDNPYIQDDTGLARNTTTPKGYVFRFNLFTNNNPYYVEHEKEFALTFALTGAPTFVIMQDSTTPTDSLRKQITVPSDTTITEFTINCHIAYVSYPNDGIDALPLVVTIN
jgi:transcriptional regulator with XRE-family HTH domain